MTVGDVAMAARIRDRRLAIGVSQDELARWSGVSLCTISHVENGRVEERGKRVLMVLHVTLTEAERRWAGDNSSINVGSDGLTGDVGRGRRGRRVGNVG